MNLISFLKKIQLILNAQSKSLFLLNVENLKKYLYGFKEPQNNIERSYFQYLCQRYCRNKVLNFIVNVISLPIFYYNLCKYTKNIIKESGKDSDAVFIPEGKDITVIPKSLLKMIYKLVNEEKEEYILLQSDKDFINRIKQKYSFDYEFLLKILIKIARYRAILIKYPKIKFIIVCAEYSYTSSILTEWCHLNQLRHINVMHGEKLFDIRDSFFNFDKCYVWDNYYKELFIKLRADDKQFVVEIPPALNFIHKKKIEKQYKFTYYLQGFESKKELKNILDCLLILTKGMNCASIRPHPRYSNMQIIKDVFESKINIEDNSEINIEDSILRTENVISLYSTVLNQAFYNNSNVIIDDVSNNERFEKLKSLEYKFILHNDFRKLSDILCDGLNKENVEKVF